MYLYPSLQQARSSPAFPPVRNDICFAGGSRMRFPIQLNVSMTSYMMRMKMKGVKRFPLVLMLEPLHLCNLACMGCGRIREYKDTMQDMLTLGQCLEAVR